MSDAVEIVNPAARTALLLTGDHAGNAIPEGFHDLGLPAAERTRHIAWDIGAGEVARRLAARLDATAVLARFSRLLIDPNRPLGEPDSIPRGSDGTTIPGNQNLTAEDRIARAAEFFTPYHSAIDAEIARLRQSGVLPAVLAVHSCTPQLSANGAPRPWHIGVMFSHDRTFADYLISALATQNDLTVGVNEPYSGFIHGYAQKRHGLAQCLPHAQIEIRQDLIGDARGQEEWAARLATVMDGWFRRHMKEAAHG